MPINLITLVKWTSELAELILLTISQIVGALIHKGKKCSPL